MKLIRNGEVIDFSHLVEKAKVRLTNERVLIADSFDHVDDVAAFLAWREVGGNIFVKSTLLPPKQSEHLDNLVDKFEGEDSILFHTSGTTGMPKLVQHKRKQIDECSKMNQKVLGWNSDTKHLNFMPAFTSGFWLMVLPAWVDTDSTLVIGSKETAIKDLTESDANCSIIVPGLIDFISSRGVKIDFSKYDKIIVGAAQVLPRHVKYLFDNGLKTFVQAYGSTEMGVPIVQGVQTEMSETAHQIDMTMVSEGSEIKFVDDELWFKGPSLCENYKDLTHHEKWFRSNDLWNRNGNLMEFKGRINDLVKVNGYQGSLLLIENVAEDRTNLGDTLAVKRNSHGSDWIELFYTNKECEIDKNHFKELFEDILLKCTIPRKYTYIESIPRNSMGKKLRDNSIL